MAKKKNTKPTLEVVTNNTKPKGERFIRSVWDNETSQWCYPVIDIVGVLTDTADPADYTKKMKRRDRQLNEEWYSMVRSLMVKTNGGIQPLNCVNLEGAFRVIMSIPSPKAEALRLWMSKLLAEKITDIIANTTEIESQPATLAKTIMSCAIKHPKGKRRSGTKNVEKLLVSLLNPGATNATPR